MTLGYPTEMEDSYVSIKNMQGDEGKGKGRKVYANCRIFSTLDIYDNSMSKLVSRLNWPYMSDDLGRIECRICGQSIYFIHDETDVEVSGGFMELTCSRGHTDTYRELQVSTQEVKARVEMSRPAAVGF